MITTAYNKTISEMLIPSVVLCALPLIAACCTTNFYLGTNQNAIESKEVLLKEKPELEEKAQSGEGRSF